MGNFEESSKVLDTLGNPSIAVGNFGDPANALSETLGYHPTLWETWGEHLKVWEIWGRCETLFGNLGHPFKAWNFGLWTAWNEQILSTLKIVKLSIEFCWKLSPVLSQKRNQNQWREHDPIDSDRTNHSCQTVGCRINRACLVHLRYRNRSPWLRRVWARFRAMSVGR